MLRVMLTHQRSVSGQVDLLKFLSLLIGYSSLLLPQVKYGQTARYLVPSLHASEKGTLQSIDAQMKRQSPYFDFTQPILNDLSKKGDPSIKYARYLDPCNSTRYQEVISDFMEPSISLNWTRVLELQKLLWARVQAEPGLGRDICYSNSGDGPALMCGFGLDLSFHNHPEDPTRKPSSTGLEDTAHGPVDPRTLYEVIERCRCFTYFSFISYWDPLKARCVVPTGSPCGPTLSECGSENSFCVGRHEPRVQDMCICEPIQDDLLLVDDCKGLSKKRSFFHNVGTRSSFSPSPAIIIIITTISLYFY